MIPDALRLAVLLILLLVVTGCSMASSKPENCAIYDGGYCVETYAEQEERNRQAGEDAQRDQQEDEYEEYREQRENRSRDLDCGDFERRRDAQAELESNPFDPYLLDEDNDGRACERLDW